MEIRNLALWSSFYHSDTNFGSSESLLPTFCKHKLIEDLKIIPGINIYDLDQEYIISADCSNVKKKMKVSY